MITNISELTDVSVAEVAIEFPCAINVFMKHNIDFCCGGQQNFQEACKKKGLNSDMIWDEIIHRKPTGDALSLRFNSWNTSLLIEYIIQNHHVYVKEAIPQLQELLDKVCSVHGEDYIELSEIRDDFGDLANELITHLNKEEKILFPAILKHGFNSEMTMKGPITIMESEHELAGDLMKSIRQLTKHYTIPRDACPTLELTYKKLQEFDADLMQHIHLENNVLFKKVSALAD